MGTVLILWRNVSILCVYCMCVLLYRYYGCIVCVHYYMGARALLYVCTVFVYFMSVLLCVFTTIWMYCRSVLLGCTACVYYYMGIMVDSVCLPLGAAP